MRVSGFSFQAANSFKNFFRIISRTLPVLLLTLAALALAGCVGSEDEEGGGTVDLTVIVDFGGVSGASFTPMISGGTAAVDSVYVSVTGPGVSIVRQLMDETSPPDSNVWTTTIPGLPVDTSLTFTGEAFDSTDDSGTLLFEGTEPVILFLAGPDNITMSLTAVDDGTSSVPILGTINVAVPIGAGSEDNPISWDVTHDASVGWEVTLPSKIGSLSSTGDLFSQTGEINPPASAGTAPVSVSYTPETDDSLTHDIKVKVWDVAVPTNWVSKEYVLSVLDAGTTGIGVIFGPSITAIQFTRTADSLIVTVTVDSPFDGAVSYQWTGDGSFSGVDATTASLTLNPFDTTKDGGTISVAVTGTTTLLVGSTSYTIDVGDFPY